MPKFFGEPLQGKLNVGDSLDFVNLSALCLSLGSLFYFILQQKADSNYLRFVVAKVIDCYPSIVRGNKGESKGAMEVKGLTRLFWAKLTSFLIVEAAVFFIEKLQKYMKRKNEGMTPT